ncbi:NucA/NucB deoxyribonuclease domain-containing protein, partial [Nonomuraea sp. B5E05]|uniref:NucA/NucB deoxyribonuclease domain-containing protein n=1 Tax=Nonomuraea sp. B5E05 TaxID=3153569 RepID=UPI003260A559
SEVDLSQDQLLPGALRFSIIGGAGVGAARGSHSVAGAYAEGLTEDIGDWIQGPDRLIVLTSPAASFPGPDHRGFCGIRPSVYYPETDDVNKQAGWLDDDRLEFRCDSSPKIAKHTGGCVVWSSRPVWHLDGNRAANPDTGIGVDQTAAHIWKALYDQQNTDTKYYDANGEQKTKNIPGRYNSLDRGCASQTGCLTRSTEKRTVKGTVPDLNGRAAKRECRKIRTTPPGVTKRSCDEYPFASTHEGVHYAGINFSVAIIECQDNTTAGALLSGWYQQQRILEKDPFWVDATKKGSTPPAGVIPPDVTTPDLSGIGDGCSG